MQQNGLAVSITGPKPSDSYTIDEEGEFGWRVLGPEGAIVFRILKRQVPMYHERLRVHPVYNGLNGVGTILISIRCLGLTITCII